MKPVNSIIIVGGGTAGWMAAAALSKHFSETPVRITLIESSDIGSVGVGEATIPTIRKFYKNLGLSDAEVMRKTQATCKLGIEFKGWKEKESSFMHPFGGFGQEANKIRFHHYWMKLRQLGLETNIADYSLGASLAMNNKFILPPTKPRSAIEVFDWALHFDASLFANLMKERALECGVRYVDAKIERVLANDASGCIDGIVLDAGKTLQSDLYIDCSGFQALLIEQTLKTGFEDWSHWLFCDSALAVQSERKGLLPPRTIATAKESGWQWKIPLQHRQGNGIVYCSKYMNSDEAKETLMKDIDGPTIGGVREFKFLPGRRAKAWNKNCIALGLASGFLEPLESTSIGLIETSIERICLSLKTPSYDEKKIARFNEVFALEYERVRDFIILHYKQNQRIDSDFWNKCRNASIPETLKNKMHAFKQHGDLVRLPWEMFGPDSWIAIYSGLDFLPNSFDKNLEYLDSDKLKVGMEGMKRRIANIVEAAHPHSEFIEQHCVRRSAK